MTKDDLPQGFVSRMERQLGSDAAAFFSSYERPYRRCLRVNTAKISVEAFRALSPFALTPIPWEESGFYVDASDAPGRHPYHDAGLYYMQEASAMAVAAVGCADMKDSEKVLDLCAAPGGKSTQIASKMKGKGLLVSNEIDPARARILSQNIERMGIGNDVVTSMAAPALAEHFPGMFDRIFLDAPCSGEGMFRKEEAAITQWSEEKISGCADIQRGLLPAAASMLSWNGTLIYSTCTFAPEEDEEQIALFLTENPEFHLIPWNPVFDTWGFSHGDGRLAGDLVCGVPIPESIKESLSSCIRLYPHRLEGEGHFIAMMRRREAEDGTT